MFLFESEAWLEHCACSPPLAARRQVAVPELCPITGSGVPNLKSQSVRLPSNHLHGNQLLGNQLPSSHLPGNQLRGAEPQEPVGTALPWAGLVS